MNERSSARSGTIISMLVPLRLWIQGRSTIRAVGGLTEQRQRRLVKRTWVDAAVFAALATVAWLYVSGSIALVTGAVGTFFIVTRLVLLQIASRRRAD